MTSAAKAARAPSTVTVGVGTCPLLLQEAYCLQSGLDSRMPLLVIQKGEEIGMKHIQCPIRLSS